MYQQLSDFSDQWAESGSFDWMHYADPDRNISGFAETQLRWMMPPTSLSETTTAIRMRFLRDARVSRSSHRTDSCPVLERVAQTIAAKLDAQAAKRLKRLATFADGWDQGQGQALTEDSLLGLERLLELADFRGLDVALFLSRDGQLLLNWPDAQNELVELEVARNCLMVFIGANGEEFEVPLEPGAIADIMIRVR